jgi:hypothetical protein
MPASSLRVAKKPARKIRSAAKKRGARRPSPSFAEGMRPFIGMIKNAPPDLSMREGFGDY